MSRSRTCSRTACPRGAVATLTYNYADQTVVVGPLATHAEPHTYDLCADHADRLTAPRGWDVVRLVTDYPDPVPSTDDLLALADAVREAGRGQTQQAALPGLRAAPSTPVPRPARGADTPEEGRSRRPVDPPDGDTVRETARRGHLRVLRDR